MTGGDVIATDDIGGVKHQLVKLEYGDADSATQVSDTNPLPVDDAGGSLTVDNAALSVTGGGAEATALRVTLANDSTGVVSVDDNGSTLSVDDGAGSLTVDNTNIDNLHSADFDTGAGTDTTPAVGIAVPASGGAAVIPGDATAGLKVDLGADNDVTVTGTVTVDGSGVTQPISAASLPLPTGAATAANQLPDGHNVTVDNAAGASAVNIQDGGNSITVDNGGTFAVQVDGAALTALQLIDDPVFADDAAFTLASSKVTMAGAIRDDALTTLTAVEGDAVPLRVSSTGALHVTGGGGGTEYTDDTSTHTSGSSAGGLMMAAATPTDGAVDANDIGAVAMSVDRRLHVDAQIVGQDADVTIADGGNSLTVDAPVGTPVNVQIGDGVDTALVSAAGALSVDGSGVTQPISAASLPLPSGAATAANQLPDGHNVTVDNAAGASAVNIQDGGNSITVDGTVTADAGTGPWPVTDNGGSLTVDNGGTFAVQSTLQTGSALVGDVGLSGARTSGGTTLYKNIDVDETEDQVKGTAGQVYWIHAMNLSSAPLYLKFYNATAATVTVGTTTPDLTFPIPTQGDTNGAGFTISIPNGIAFSTAITIAATTGVADNDSGAPGANAVVVNLGYA